MAVSTCGQCLVANLIDEISDNHLRQTVRDVLAHGRYAYVKQVFQLLPGDWPEIMQREAGNVYLKMDASQQHHGHGTTGGCCDSGTLDTQLRTAPAAEDKSIVTKYIQHVYDTRHHHRINYLVGTA